MRRFLVALAVVAVLTIGGGAHGASAQMPYPWGGAYPYAGAGWSSYPGYSAAAYGYPGVNPYATSAWTNNTQPPYSAFSGTIGEGYGGTSGYGYGGIYGPYSPVNNYGFNGVSYPPGMGFPQPFPVGALSSPYGVGYGWPYGAGYPGAGYGVYGYNCGTYGYGLGVGAPYC
jgi:hypothetical protein